MKNILVIGTPMFCSLLLLCACRQDDNKWGTQSFWSGNDLQALCARKDSSPIALSGCGSYIIGAVDSYAASYRKEHGRDWLCGDPKEPDVINASINYMEAHPDRLNEPAGRLVVTAVGKANGCESD